ncbi:MAG: M56 family metallopeptidase [Gemmataceae bacterium]
MTAVSFMHSPLWQATGWMMLHFLWAGGAVALLAAVARWLLRSAAPERRYAVALGSFLALAASPVVIGVCLRDFLTPVTEQAESPPAVKAADESLLSADRPLPEIGQLPALNSVQSPAPGTGSARAPFSAVAQCLPWLWLIGSPLTLLTTATGLLGVERLKRRTTWLREGELPDLCRRLARSLGIAREVTVGVCERLAAPILVGVVRPLILLPPAALTGWSVEQVEMVLLHELAHVRRWDTLANFLQRIVEALLFFHPVVWWLSAWIRLERELCCDRVVIARTGRPREYAGVLAALAPPDPAVRHAALAMAENSLVTRIRRILNPEYRTMNASPKALVLAAALPIAALVSLGLYAHHARLEAAPKPVEAADEEQPKQPEPLPLPAGQSPAGEAAAKGKPVGNTLTFPGEVEPSERVELFARVGGTVQKVHVDIGDRVKKGQLLAELAVPELEAEYRQKQAGVIQAKAEVEVARRSGQASRVGLEAVTGQVREGEAGVKTAQAAFTLHKAELARTEKLFNDKSVERRILDAAQSKLDTAQAALEAAEARIQTAKANTEEAKAKLAKTEADQRVTEAKLAVAEAELQRAAVMVQFARITAPIDGVVTRRTVDAGSFAPSAERGRTEPLFVVARTDMVRVVIHVAETDVARLGKGTPAVFRLAAQKGRQFEAKVSRLAGAIDRTNGTLRVEIDLPNPDGKILVGMYGTVTLTVEK